MSLVNEDYMYIKVLNLFFYFEIISIDSYEQLCLIFYIQISFRVSLYS